MRIIVKKFGGTSLANIDCIHHVANVIRTQQRPGVAQVIVVSASAGTTNQLATWCDRMHSVSSLAQQARDFVLSSGEWITAGLLAMALDTRGLPARPWAGWQLPLTTDDRWGQAHALHTNPQRLQEDIDQGIVPVVCGFQGVTADGFVTTLGRGGSDTTAVILAAALNTKECEIYTDVTGVYSADPSLVDNALLYANVSYESMLTLSQHGAKVLHAPSIQWAEKNHIPIHVRSTHQPHLSGTWIKKAAPHAWGVTCRPVLVWHQDALLSQEDPSMSWVERVRPIDWILTHHGIQWMTWVEEQKNVQQEMPRAVMKNQATLVSVVGSTDPAIHQLMVQSQLVQHRFVKQNVMGVALPAQEAYALIRRIHDHWLHHRPPPSHHAHHGVG